MQKRNDQRVNNGPGANLKKTHEYQTSIVLTTIEAAIEQLKISFMLPKIFENPKILESCLKGTPHEKCLDLVLEYREERNLQSDEKHRELLNIIDHFHTNYDVLKFLTNWSDDYDEEEIMILKAFVTLVKIAKERLGIDAREQLLKEKPVHQFYNDNEKFKKNIKDLLWKNKFNKTTLWKQAAKAGLLKDLETELDDIRAGDQLVINKKIIENTKEVRKLNASFASKLREFDEQYEKVSTKYDHDLQLDLKKEKILRDEKNKFQSQFEMLINKYKQVIAEKQSEESDVDQMYDELKIGFAEFMVEYDREYEAYEKIAVQLEKKRQQQIVLWSRNYLARKIQRWWRRLIRQKRRLERKRAEKEAKMAAKAVQKGEPKKPVAKSAGVKKAKGKK